MSDMSESNPLSHQDFKDLAVKIDAQAYARLLELADRSAQSKSELVKQALNLLFAQFEQAKQDASANLIEQGDRPTAANPNNFANLKSLAELNAQLDQHSQQIAQLQAEISNLKQQLASSEQRKNIVKNKAIDPPPLNPLTTDKNPISKSPAPTDDQPVDFNLSKQAKANGDRNGKVSQPIESDVPTIPSVRKLEIGDLVQVRDQQSPYYLQILPITKVGLIRASVTGELGESSILKRDLRYVRSPSELE
ncbi:hypothetical protein Pse7367_2555 [Thalassoporum mexicanum PCC 7367]|uniref:ribbon-helix-helix protein, CopG family n=1 Tax=Thalassoporum mexicanum TaxID=3457544 RepID=UPI00029F9122|nr:ribbon-helix-helix protein, CopG family [Pseudanabaena sp. PCC 7367]AFY70813.1 hypothetical protein Pse7367_2555 [Pseudanabaena sp. PCC 7367]